MFGCYLLSAPPHVAKEQTRCSREFTGIAASLDGHRHNELLCPARRICLCSDCMLPGRCGSHQGHHKCEHNQIELFIKVEDTTSVNIIKLNCF